MDRYSFPIRPIRKQKKAQKKKPESLVPRHRWLSKQETIGLSAHSTVHQLYQLLIAHVHQLLLTTPSSVNNEIKVKHITHLLVCQFITLLDYFFIIQIKVIFSWFLSTFYNGIYYPINLEKKIVCQNLGTLLWNKVFNHKYKKFNHQ